MLRLNTAIAPSPPAARTSLGVLGGDLAGFPNGRRPGDDVVDIALRAGDGRAAAAGAGAVGQPAVHRRRAGERDDRLHDGRAETVATPAFRLFRDTFPYLQTPVSGSPVRRTRSRASHWNRSQHDGTAEQGSTEMRCGRLSSGVRRGDRRAECGTRLLDIPSAFIPGQERSWDFGCWWDRT